MTRGFKSSDLEDFEGFVREYQDRVYNLCRYMLREPQDAQDAAQDAFLKAFNGFKNFSPGSSFYAWLYRIAVHTCLDYRRKVQRDAHRHDPLPEELPSNEPFPADIYESRESTEAIQAALQKLPVKLRTTIVLREIEGLSYEEIAEVLHASVGTVKSRISRAREELRRILLRKQRQDLQDRQD